MVAICSSQRLTKTSLIHLRRDRTKYPHPIIYYLPILIFIRAQFHIEDYPNDASPNLTIKQQRFVEEYQMDGNGSQAILRAGYKTKHPAEITYGL